MSIEAASPSSQLKAAVPVKIPRMKEEMQKIETMQHLNKTKDALDRVRKTLTSTEEDGDCGTVCLRIAARNM